MDNLKQLFLKQINLQERLNGPNFEIVGNQQFINVMTIALIDELMEAIRETPWKPWKKQQQFNKSAYQDELIDAWHFLINLTLASGMTSSDLYNKFIEKNKENHSRQDRGY
jgi:dimeric dUTPase (all-alpha-NTP-PPase superfamily)